MSTSLDRQDRSAEVAVGPQEPSSSVSWQAAIGQRPQLGDRLANRKWPCVATLISLVLGMLYTLAWAPLVHHDPIWSAGPDVWAVFRGAHYVGWGFVGGIYAPGSGIVAFPGMPVLLAPVAMLSSALGLTESSPPFYLAHPTAALLLQPVELLVSSTVIFATDALAERVSVSRRRRIELCVLVAVIAFPVGVIWGHAEDALAMTFAIYAVLALLDGKWSRCGWLLGVGIVIQPLVALMLPLMVGASPTGRRVAVAVRSVSFSVMLVGVAFLGNAADTYRAVVQQPAIPATNHPTPWLHLAPRLAPDVRQPGRAISLVGGHGHFAAHAVAGQALDPIVTGGVGRTFYLVFAVLLGIYVWRRPQSALRLVWLVGVVLAGRCFFEAVMCPYYLAPPLFVALTLAARREGIRFWAASVVAMATSVYAYLFLSPWVWWIPVCVGVAAVLGLGYPAASEASSDGCGPRPDGAKAVVQPLTGAARF